MDKAKKASMPTSYELETAAKMVNDKFNDDGDANEGQTDEGNAFAQAVQQAKAAGMKKGDKFKVGDKEYTLKDAIELAGLQLEDFFSEEEMEVPAEAHDEAEAINTELDRIKTLANLS